MAKVDGTVLREIRKERGLSRRELAGQSRIDQQTIYRLERNEPASVRKTTVERLCAALGVSEPVLTGQVPRIPLRPTPTQAEPDKDQFNVQINNAARNAFALVARRYGVPVPQIVELAPLLFYLAAEQSLAERSRKLDEVDEADWKLDELRKSIPYLPPSPRYDEILEVERRSVEHFDVLGKIIDEAPIHRFEKPTEFTNPFAAFLNSLSSRCEKPLQFLGWERGDSPIYLICRGEAVQLVGGDEDAASAILNGIAPLHEMPKDARGTPESRAAWVRGKAEETQRQLAELLASLDLTDIFPDSQS